MLLVTQTNCDIVWEGLNQGCEYWEARTIEGYLGGWLPKSILWFLMIHVPPTCKIYSLPLKVTKSLISLEHPLVVQYLI